ncbi:MAG: hypothetical protein KZQ83_18335 [gamma proteobacterium symbiont of Taylorina sp.]|nr:hypothetical protein [gamma proteobacterium symbiont of Taylorina sp.]
MKSFLDPVSTYEREEFNIQVASEKQRLEQQIKAVRESIQQTKTNQLINQGYSPDKAKAQAELISQERTMLTPDYILKFDDGQNVSVGTVLKNPDKYNNQPMADPLEPEEGYGKAKFYANKETGNPLVHSFLHGKQIYPLVTEQYVELYNQHKKHQQACEGFTGPLKELSGAIFKAIERKLPNAHLAILWDNFGKCFNSTFIEKGRNQVYALNKYGDLPAFTKTSFKKNIQREIFGGFVDYGTLGNLIDDFLPMPAPKGDDEDKAKAKAAAEAKAALRKGIDSIVYNSFDKHIEIYRQRSIIRYETDMFATESQLIIEKDSVLLRSIHEPFPILKGDGGGEEKLIIMDYKEHFPELDSLISLVAASRFASDRKKAFFWLKAVSDWGKGFLSSIFKNLGILVELSVKEIESALSGSPIGKQPNDFKHCWILHVDEFKKVNSEVKQLTSTFRGSPKNQMTFECPLYMKLFTSAEEVESLAGSGVETQFSNRFSLIPTTDTSIEDRDVFNNIGKTSYLQTVQNYIARELNKKVDEYVQLGRVKSADKADMILKEYNSEHKLSNYYGSLDDVLEEIALNLKVLIRIESLNKQLLTLSVPGKLKKTIKANKYPVTYDGEEVWLVKYAPKIISIYIDENISPSEKAKIGYKKSKIRELMDESKRESNKLDQAVRVFHQGSKTQKQERGIIIRKKD